MSVKIRRKKQGIDTGCTLLNLALSGDPSYGLLPGHLYWFCGNSNSGKTFTGMSVFAEALRHPVFKDWNRVFHDKEHGMLMDTQHLFGVLPDELFSPLYEDGEGDDNSLEAFYYGVDDLFDRGKPFILLLDSMDALVAAADENKHQEERTAFRKGKKVTGSYKMVKAKKNSEMLRRCVAQLRKTQSIIIIVSQARVNLLGQGSSYSGGRALKFYATAQIEMKNIGRIKKKVRGKDRKIGDKIQMQTFAKNRETGKGYKIETAIYPSYGIDDIGSCIDYLVSEGWWKKQGKSKIKSPFGTVMKATLATRIAEECREDELREAVAACWAEIERQSVLKRKRRYD